MSKYFLPVIFMCALTVCVNAQNPTHVYWLHGLNDNWMFWDKYQKTITPLYWDNQQYDSNDSAYITASAISNRMASPAILVGHSAGGVIAREVAEVDQGANTIKGIITFGTPNSGAGIVRSVLNHDYYNVIDRAGEKVASAINGTLSTISILPFPAIVSIVLYLQNSLAVGGLEMLGLEMCKDIADSYVNENYLSCQLFRDLSPDSNTINSLPQINQTIPIINYYGEEDTWPLIRLLGSLSHSNDIRTQHFSSNVTYDDAFLGYMRTAESVCNGFIAGHAAISAALGVISFYNPSFLPASVMSAYAVTQWNSLKRYIDYDMHNDYSELIGAYHYVVKEETTGWWLWRRVTYTTVKVYEGHDGLVAKKQSMMDTSSGNVINISLPGVNHMEMNGHPLAKVAIIQSLNGLVDSRINMNN
ncbi:MAG: alpha/beta hydrolase [Bacteroidales bacterium]|nr:alpha/beta hydrolase [Bacteroidales bacterium]